MGLVSFGQMLIICIILLLIFGDVNYLLKKLKLVLKKTNRKKGS